MNAQFKSKLWIVAATCVFQLFPAHAMARGQSNNSISKAQDARGGKKTASSDTKLTPEQRELVVQ